MNQRRRWKAKRRRAVLRITSNIAAVERVPRSAVRRLVYHGLEIWTVTRVLNGPVEMPDERATIVPVDATMVFNAGVVQG